MCGLNLACRQDSLVMCSCDHSNKPWGSLNIWDFHAQRYNEDHLRNMTFHQNLFSILGDKTYRYHLPIMSSLYAGTCGSTDTLSNSRSSLVVEAFRFLILSRGKRIMK
jgi:hypothetical protein